MLKIVRPRKNPCSLEAFKVEDVAFVVGVYPLHERSGSQVYSAGRLFISRVLMDRVVSQGFYYTPTKVLWFFMV